ncbi:FecR family protein [Pseudomonas sp. UBA4194]|uniref:FecR family protein n=1 Tax=Pseudomonas sp. UBA4194 TaxID=1947317 RepID=UPI0025CC827C|nr:FecR family protein [Pseudomonas sp. UBA4194]
MNSNLVVTAEQEDQALAWLTRLRDQPDAAERMRFNTWLHADPAHAEAYVRAQVLWELCEGPAGELAREDAHALQGYLAAMDAPRPPASRHWAAALAVAACLVLMIGVGAGWNPLEQVQDLGADYVAPVGHLRSVTLADNSEVILDANSAIAVDFSHGMRRVQLRRGAAFFHVAHTGEPFVVQAADGEAKVLGTQFEVRLHNEGAQVTVLEGRVAVSAQKSPEQQVLGANRQVAYSNGVAQPQHAVDSTAQLAWREGWLNYYKAPLADVVRDLGRYYPGRILLFSNELGQRTISGSFPSDKPQAVLDSLQRVLGFAQHKLPGGMIVLR